MLAIKEIQRGKGRFASIIAALSLIVFLVLILSALADGLFFGSTGAVRSTNAQAYVFASDAKGSLLRSNLPESQVAEVGAVPGVAAASGVGVLLTAGTVDGSETDLAVFGVEAGGAGVPTQVTEGRLPEAGESGAAAIDARLVDALDAGVGSTITVGNETLSVVGVAKDVSYQLQSSVWTSVADWREMRNNVRPEFGGVSGDINVIAVQLADGATVDSVAQALPDLTTLSSEEVGLAIPGVEQQAATLNAIIYTALAVAALVVALFFALVVLEKRELFAALKALGTPTRKLGIGVVVQAVVASAIGVMLGALAARALGMVLPAEVPTLFRSETLATIAVFTLVAGVLGAVFSLRRIAKIDPATAIGGAL